MTKQIGRTIGFGGRTRGVRLEHRMVSGASARRGQWLLVLLALVVVFLLTVTWRAAGGNSAALLQPKSQHNATTNTRRRQKEGEVKTRLQSPLDPAATTTETTIIEGITDHNEVKPNFQVYKSDKEYSGKGNFFQPYVVEEYKLVFFHIPKNGCTKWKWIMRKLSGQTEPLPMDQTIHNPKHNGIPRLGNFSTERASEFFMAADWTRAMFLRDPIERWLSAYLEKIVEGKSQLVRCCHKITGQWPPQHGLQHYPRNSTPATTATRWEQCRQLAQSSPEQGLAIMKRCKDIHWNPQSSRLANPRYWPTINFWGRVDDMERDTERLLRRIGAWNATMTNKTPDQANQSTALLAVAENDAATKEDRAVTRQTGQRHASHATDKVAQYISPELRRQLMKFYHDDYENPYFDFGER